MRITLDVHNTDASEALVLVEEFLTKYPNNHRAWRPERHGVIFSMKGGGGVFYVYGNVNHVRVRQEESPP